MPRKALPLAAVVLMGGAAAAHALDPSRATSQYVVTRWGARELSGHSVHALLQTADRYLWLGTTTGLVRFDGARFVVYGAHTTPGFGDGGVTSLAAAQGGGLYAGTTSGHVVRLERGAFTLLPLPQRENLISSLYESPDGALWLSQHARPVYRWKDGRASTLRERIPGFGPVVIAPDRRGGLWFGTRQYGLVHHDGQAYRPLPGVSDAVQALHVDRAGGLWVGTPRGLLRVGDGGAPRRFTTRDGLSHDDVSAILEDRDGNLWIGTVGGGLSRWSRGRFSRFTTAEGLSDDHVRSLLEDHEGNLWVGTADGLTRLSEGRFITYGRLEGLDDPVVTAVAPGRDGAVWVGTGSGRVAELRGGRFTTFRLPDAAGPDAVVALRQVRGGDVWISTDDARLFRLRGGRLTAQPLARREAMAKVSAIFEDAVGPVFHVNGGGLMRPRQGRLVALHPKAPRVGYVHDVLQDPDGTLWLGSSAGLVRVRGDAYRLFTEADGLPHRRVRSLCGDGEGGLWLATGGGLAHFRDGVFRALGVAQGLPESYLRLVVDDGLGHLWVASMGHVARIDRREALDVLAGRAPSISAAVHDTEDGLRATEAALSSNPGFRDEAGRLWLATTKGVAVLDPRRVDRPGPAPAVVIEGVRVDGVAEPRGEYPPGRGEVTIEYTALSFRRAARTRFRYRLAGLDAGWVEAGARRSAYYSNLPPGHYRFTVMASTPDGLWNGEAAAFAFAIRPPFHRTAAFYALCAAAGLALLGAAHRLRVGRMRSRFAATVAERTRIARELHDTLAQMLAGVGFQIDTALQRLPAGSGLAPVRRNMELAHSMVDAGLAEVRRSIWVLRAQAADHPEGLAALLSTSLAQLTGGSRVGSTFDVAGTPRPLSPEVERSLLRIAHEAVANAVRHSQARSIGIRLEFEAEAVGLRVNDDGRGFDPVQVRSDRFGLLGIVEHARAVGGVARVASRPGGGTEISCRLPYTSRG